ncbi:hypothetical protein GCM10009692_00650 [Leucobacter aridicollis]
MVSHWIVVAPTPNSVMSGGRATLRTVSLRIMTKAEAASIAITAVTVRMGGVVGGSWVLPVFGEDTGAVIAFWSATGGRQ